MPNSRIPAKKQSGFTLIELLVVIAIIAILSVIAATSYAGLQKNARDSKRLTELEAIANALEINKDYAGYNPLNPSEFAGNKLPGQDSPSSVYAIDPKHIPFCISVTSGVSDADTAGWAASSDPGNSAGVCPITPVGADYQPIDNTIPLPENKQWKVCTLLETTPAVVRCKSSAQ